MQTDDLPTTPALTLPGLCCAKCEYDLAGLSEAAVCPECEFSVRESKRIASLPKMPPWLEQSRSIHAACCALFVVGMFVEAAPSAAVIQMIGLAGFGTATAFFGMWLARRSKPYGKDRLPWLITAIQTGLLLITFVPAIVDFLRR